MKKKCMVIYKIYIFKIVLNLVNFLYIKSIFDIIIFINRENIFMLVCVLFFEIQLQNEIFIEIVKIVFFKKKKKFSKIYVYVVVKKYLQLICLYVYYMQFIIIIVIIL